MNLLGCLGWEMTCNRHNHDSISNPLPVSDVHHVCDRFSHDMIQLAQEGASPFHTLLSKFQQIRALKCEEQEERQYVSQRTT